MSIHSERTARKRYRCGFECGEPIQPGSHYVRAALPPGCEPNYGEHWWVLTMHGHTWDDCPAHQRLRAERAS